MHVRGDLICMMHLFRWRAAINLIFLKDFFHLHMRNMFWVPILYMSIKYYDLSRKSSSYVFQYLLLLFRQTVHRSSWQIRKETNRQNYKHTNIQTEKCINHTNIQTSRQKLDRQEKERKSRNLYNILFILQVDI